MSERNFKVTAPHHMRGSDIADWQEWLSMTFRRWDIDYPLKHDGDYGVATRAATATVCEAFGLVSPYGMQNGVTPHLRTKLRNRRFSVAERARYVTRAPYRADLRARLQGGGAIHTPLSNIITDAWGWHPGIHDGIDLICPPNATLFAICSGRIIRADAGGWWGLGAPTDPDLKARGDGIIIIRCAINAGPFHDGLNCCYGHAEHATVKAGDSVRAGDVIGKAGFANAWHVHFMVNDRNDDRGVGDRDPRPYTDYARGK